MLWWGARCRHHPDTAGELLCAWLGGEEAGWTWADVPWKPTDSGGTPSPVVPLARLRATVTAAGFAGFDDGPRGLQWARFPR